MIQRMPTNLGTLTFSRRPTDAVYAELERAELDIWWNVARELGDLVPRMATCAAEVLWAPIADYSVPADTAAFAEQLDRVCVLLGCHGRVHVNCYGGRGRTGLALACVRMVLEEETPDQALAAAYAACGGPETEAQRGFVADLHRQLRAHG
jgi:protein-tyrosine phosphatase